MTTHNDQTAQVQSIKNDVPSGLTLCAAISVALLSGCAATTPNYDATFSEATRATFQQQIINPDAGGNQNPVAGIDGKAGNEVIKNYHESFNTPQEAENALNIGVGDSSDQ
ncbi:MAG: hypothetical protein ACT4OH_00045 [Methylophilaceae bacterium]